MMKNTYVLMQNDVMCMRMLTSRAELVAGMQVLLSVRPEMIRC